MYPDDEEDDDDLHNPDDLEGRDCDVFTKRGLLNVGSLVLITIGILALFVGYPLITAVENALNPQGKACEENPDCISASLPLLKNIRTGLIDPQTPKSAHTRTAIDGSSQTLVVSSV